jgi:hypothetical protein
MKSPSGFVGSRIVSSQRLIFVPIRQESDVRIRDEELFIEVAVDHKQLSILSAQLSCVPVEM